jgi:hypothetical protein
MDENTKIAFDFARDTTKQLIALATGIIAFTITFSKDFIRPLDMADRILASLCWVMFLLSVLFGLWTLLALTGTLEPQAGRESTSTPSIRGSNVTLPSKFQVITFFVGLLLTVLLGIAVILQGPVGPGPR